MKTRFFLSFLALFLIQGPAGATPITTTYHLHASLTGDSCTPSTCFANFTLTVDDSNPTSSYQNNTLAWDIELNTAQNLQSLAKANLAKQGTGSFGFTFASGVSEVFLGHPISGNRIGHFLEIAEISPPISPGSSKVTQFITGKQYAEIDVPSDGLSGGGSLKTTLAPEPKGGPMTVNSDCTSAGDSSCAVLTTPSTLISGGYNLYVYNNGSLTNPLNLQGQITVLTAPTPGSLSLFGIGLAGLGLLRQRRKQWVDRFSAA